MRSERHRRISELFTAASDLEPERRAPFLERECADDRELRAEVEALLEHDADDSFLDRPAGGTGAVGQAELERRALLTRLATRVAGSSRYQIDGEIGRGGMGRVLGALDNDLRRRLAMKVLHDDPCAEGSGPGSGPSPGPDPHSLSRFLDEAQVTGQLDHPGVVPVHELGMDADGHVYFTMRLVQGDHLGEIFRKVRSAEDDWNVTRAVGVIQKVCETMAFAHDKGVVHRDLKPANIMVGRYGEVYVMDWGLARVEGEEDRHDLRLRPDVSDSVGATSVRTTRASARDSDPDSPLLTMDGTVMGTPYYMPPEQAVGRVDVIGPSADVYAVGAMLYQLLVGRAPYREPDTDEAPRAVIARVRGGPPASVHGLAEAAPDRLRAICEVAMARQPGERYASMGALADDLRAYLEHRVVRAYRTGAWAEAVMWVRRNRPLAAALATVLIILVAGGVATWLQKKRADEQAQGVLRLSGFRTLEELQQRADDLWPVHSQLIPQYVDWLRDAATFVGTLDQSEDGGPGLRAQLAALRTGATTRATVDLPAQRRRLELEHKQAKLAALRRQQEIRDGSRTHEAFTLDPSWGSRTADELRTEAQWRVHPGERIVFGQEAEGLALARLAVQRADSEHRDDPRLRSACRLALSFALLANGLDAEVLALCEWYEKAPVHAWVSLYLGWGSEHMRIYVEAARRGDVRDAIAELEAEVDLLAKELEPDPVPDLPTEQERWWYGQLERLVREIEAFADAETGLVEGVSTGRGRGVRWRLDRARELRDRTLTDAAAQMRWREAIAAIRGDPQYRGLDLEPIFGLVPIGTDPGSGFQEFVHVLTGDEPGRDADGHLRRSEAMGIVLVLLPGGPFTMGTHSTDEGGPGYDPHTKSTEYMPHEVQCSPFFMAKYEVTQAQWERFTGSNPSAFPFADISVGWNKHGREADGTHPVEQVSWHDAMRVLRQMGLGLPTEAQWEYAARAGTSTIWWSGDDPASLVDAGNVADAFDAWKKPEWKSEKWNDGELIHAPVGTFRANPFGLHDVCGNVSEWCYDGMSMIYEFGLPDDPVYPPWLVRTRVLRGGAYRYPAVHARSGCRDDRPPETADNWIGVRAGRGLQDFPTHPARSR